MVLDVTFFDKIALNCHINSVQECLGDIFKGGYKVFNLCSESQSFRHNNNIDGKLYKISFTWIIHSYNSIFQSMIFSWPIWVARSWTTSVFFIGATDGRHELFSQEKWIKRKCRSGRTLQGSSIKFWMISENPRKNSQLKS